MNFYDELSKISTIFIDTAPIIYHIEAHPQFGPLVKLVAEKVKTGDLVAFTSVITLTEVLPKPIQMGREDLAEKFIKFLEGKSNIILIEISADIAKIAGYLRGKYHKLKSLDAIQLATSIKLKVDAFLTNDLTLKEITDLRVLVLKDYL